MIDPARVLPPGTPLTREWCLDARATVTSSAYHGALGVGVPPYSLGRAWVNRPLNFDNVPRAVWTLFSISTTELWVTTMQARVLRARACCCPAQPWGE